MIKETKGGTVMKMKTTMVSLLAIGLLPFAVGATAQHSQHHPSASESNSQMMMNQGMMGHGMVGQGMMANHQEMMNLMVQLATDFSALENEKDVAVIRKKLAEDRALLQQLQTHMQKNGQMAGQMMDHFQNCPMTQSGQMEGQPTPK
jgi:hypothetical protein